MLDDETLRQAVTASVPPVPWTVNEPAALDRLMRASAVIGIITDRPREALRLRHRRTANRNQ